MDVLTGIYKWVLGDSLVAQLIQVAVLIFVVYTLMVMGKSFVDAVTTWSESTTMLLPYLYDGYQVVYQDPNQDGSITIMPSTNAPTGLEFSYSCFLLLNSRTFQGATQGLRHIFHKGSQNYMPLISPGVYINNTENSLVVYMNTINSWNESCTIPSIPIGKFFHLAIVVRNMDMDVYINGNVVVRKRLSSVPRQNFGDLYVFKHESYTPTGTADPAFNVLGPADGLISVLQYAGYAMNYEQIDRQVRAGPSTKLVSATQNLPPYLADNWWVTYTPGQ
jgi:hypothetical protein